jgi:hypothetical protein
LVKKKKKYKADITAITNSIKSIKRSLTFEKVDVFMDLDLEKLNIREFNQQQLDEMIFMVMGCIQKLY